MQLSMRSERMALGDCVAVSFKVLKRIHQHSGKKPGNQKLELSQHRCFQIGITVLRSLGHHCEGGSRLAIKHIMLRTIDGDGDGFAGRGRRSRPSTSLQRTNRHAFVQKSINLQ
jgi:hypothetical protein